ncbi:hypothetical protein Mapa_016532 [Marchantia paleacea]|nr:hypothetical protein Mapa_016532 [Marchantia paleacea]
MGTGPHDSVHAMAVARSGESGSATVSRSVSLTLQYLAPALAITSGWLAVVVVARELFREHNLLRAGLLVRRLRLVRSFPWRRPSALVLTPLAHARHPPPCRNRPAGQIWSRYLIPPQGS